MDIWGYLDDREREVREMSLEPAPGAQGLRISEEEGFGGQRGRLLGRAWLNNRAAIAISEVVVIVGGGVHREKYAYFLTVDGREVGGFERDPSHDPAEHRHCSDHVEHERTPCERVTFKEAVARGWQYLADNGLH